MTEHATRGRPRAMSVEERRERVLDAATAVFAERGRQGATLDEIARRAGVAKGSLYEVQGSKDDLYLDVVRRATDRLIEAERRAGAAGSGEAPVARAQRRIESVLELAVLDPDGFRILGQAREEDDPRVAEVVDAGRSVLTADIEGRLAEVDVGDAARPVVAAGLRAMVESGIRTGLAAGVPPSDLAPLLARMVVAASAGALTFEET